MGWRNVHYDPRQKKIYLFGWDKKGNRKTFVENFGPYIYIESQNHNDATSIYGTQLKKIDFKSQFERRRYVKESGFNRIFYNIRPEQQYLIDTFRETDLAECAVVNPLKIFYLDIEVYSPHAFPVPNQARFPINLITIYDSLNKEFVTFGLQHDYIPTRKNSRYIKCVSESEMLEKFLDYWRKDFPDIVTGWNSEYFDIPYIINRINQVLGEGKARDLSPVKSMYYREDTRKQFGKDLGRWHIHGMSCIDYMEAYKTFSRSEQESYALNHIAHVELGKGKIQYNATNLAKLADEDWKLFTDYNIEDVSLLIELEEKLRFLQIMRTIAYKGYTSLESTMGKISVITGAIASKALDKGFIFPTFETDDMGNYSGGFVKEIESGLREGIITFDANSLYPNTLISLNLSLETKVGKVIAFDKEKDLVEVRLVNGKIHQLTIENFQKLLKKEKLAISKAKVLYTQKKKGIIPEYVDDLYAERVATKNEMLQLEDKNQHLHKNSNEYKHNKRKIDQLNIMQYTFKILLNSIYGVFANRHSPFYDIDHAASITNTGQAVIKAANKISENYIREKYNTTEDSYVYSDTDSTHLSLMPMLNAIGEPLLLEDSSLNPTVYKLSTELQEAINSGITKWAKNTLQSIDPRFFFKRETICAVGVYQSKKHYILHVRDKGEDKPLPCDYLKYVGVEVAKSTMSEAVKTLIKQVVEAMLHTKDRRQTDDIYLEVYNKFKELPLVDIAFRCSINNYNKYEKNMVGFVPGKRTPVHVKAAIFYNLLLKEKKIDTIYDEIGSAQKIKWFYTTPTNKYNIKQIAFVNNYPKEFESELTPDYELMFEKIVAPAIRRMYECVNWRMIDIRNQYQCDLFDILGVD